MKIVPIKTGTHLPNVFEYVENPLKTHDNILVSSYMCSTENTLSDFESVRQFAMKKGNNVAHHIYQSFSPEDNVTPEMALMIGKELMKRMYPNHQYVIATHTDREHIHNHIIVNAVDFVRYKKINSNKESLNVLRTISNDICIENNLSVIEPRTTGSIKRLKDTIDEAIKNSDSFEDFLGYMQSKDYEIKTGKYISLKGAEDKRFNRLNSIGTAYTESAIRRRIENPNVTIKNKGRQVYDNKSIRGSRRKRLKFDMYHAIKKADSFEDFIRIMSEKYEVKRGVHLAFRSKDAERFIRCDSLKSFEYTEEMIRLKIENPIEFEQLKKEREENKIEKVVSSDSRIISRSQAKKNVDAQIKTMKLLSENGITSIEQLDKFIEDIKAEDKKEKNRISQIKRQISKKFDVINSKKAYWRYKPIAVKARSIKNTDERAAFIEEHKEELEKMKAAIVIMNNAKDSDGNLPAKEEIYTEIERLNEAKEHLISNNELTQERLTRFENARYNLTADEDEKQEQKEEVRRKFSNHFI